MALHLSNIDRVATAQRTLAGSSSHAGVPEHRLHLDVIASFLDKRAIKISQVKWEGMGKTKQKRRWFIITRDCLGGIQRSLGIAPLVKEVGTGGGRAEKSPQAFKSEQSNIMLKDGEVTKEAPQVAPVRDQRVHARHRPEKKGTRIRGLANTYFEQLFANPMLGRAKKPPQAPKSEQSETIRNDNEVTADSPQVVPVRGRGVHARRRRERKGASIRHLERVVAKPVQKVFASPIRRYKTTPQGIPVRGQDIPPQCSPERKGSRIRYIQRAFASPCFTQRPPPEKKGPMIRYRERVYSNPIRRLRVSPDSKTMQRVLQAARGVWKNRLLTRARRKGVESASQDVWAMMQEASKDEAMDQATGIPLEAGDALSGLEEQGNLAGKNNRESRMDARTRQSLEEDVRGFVGSGRRGV